MDTDVLVVGAGPTGLMLANQLARQGVRTLIIDRHAGPSRETRALGVQARTLEIYAKLGVVRRAIDLGMPGTGANVWAEGKWMARVPIGEAGRSATPYPYILILGQDDNERILGEKLAEAGVAVNWNTELAGIAQEAGSVTATLRSPDGASRTVSAGWVAGCDGARSSVRELNGITFPGAPYEHVFFVADVEATGSMVPDEVNIYLWQAGFHLLFPMRGDNHWRIVGILPAPLRNKDGLTFEAVVPSVREEAGAGLEIRGCSWFSTYRIHHRRAARFRAGRCFLLGDAAHIHSPMGGQGMNTGLQDAYNLAWKLGLVVKGRAAAALLDSYEEERVPVAQQLLNTTDRAFRLVVSDSRLAGLMRTQVLARIAAFAMRRERLQKLAFGAISQTRISYRESSLSSSQDDLPKGAPRSGDRFPWLRLRLQEGGPPEDLFELLDDRHFNLVLIGAQPLAEAPPTNGLLRILLIPHDPTNDAELARARIPSSAFYLLRPDGHIGLCGARLDSLAVQKYMTETIRVAA